MDKFVRAVSALKVQLALFSVLHSVPHGWFPTAGFAHTHGHHHGHRQGLAVLENLRLYSVQIDIRIPLVKLTGLKRSNVPAQLLIDPGYFVVDQPFTGLFQLVHLIDGSNQLKHVLKMILRYTICTHRVAPPRSGVVVTSLHWNPAKAFVKPSNS